LQDIILAGLLVAFDLISAFLQIDEQNTCLFDEGENSTLQCLHFFVARDIGDICSISFGLLIFVEFSNWDFIFFTLLVSNIYPR